MKITKIEKQKNNNKRYSIFIDERFAFGIDEAYLFSLKLKEGAILSKKDYDYILNYILFNNAKNIAIKYLSFKARTEYQVTQKLLQDEFSEDVIQNVIVFLKKYNYINDATFCQNFIENKMNIKGYGSLKISFELKKLGIKEHIFKDYLYKYSLLYEKQKAISLINQKFTNHDISNIDYKEKQKLYAYLARRGFCYEIINDAFKAIREGL